MSLSSKLPQFAFLFLLNLLLLTGLIAGTGDTYVNPVLVGGGADPAVLYHEGTYYAYTTNSTGCVYTSTNLVDWEQGPQVIPDHLKGAWAPEVYFHPEDGKFYLYYTNRYKIGVAVSNRPDSLFKDLGYLAIPGIDAHPFRDDDGRLYLYFTHTPAFTMYCIPMYSPYEAGGPITKCFEVSQEWEMHDHSVNEGPWMFKQDGIYYLFYSGSNGQTIFYSIGYATAPTPLGPFTKFEGNPVISHTDRIHGPGHGSFAMDRSGQWWHLYHQKTDTKKGWKRYVCLDTLEMDRDQGEIWSTPTIGTEQPVPRMDPELVWCPEISPRGSFFKRSEKVILSSRTPDAVIRYTLDGSDPTKESPVYTGPLVLDEDTLLKARAYKSGMQTSTVASMRFIRTNWELPEVKFTDQPSGDPPFMVYPSPAETAPPPR